MTDLPILFSPAMVLALLQGRKTQTRRVLSGLDDHPIVEYDGMLMWKEGYRWGAVSNPKFPPGVRFSVGDRLYVRERIQKWLSMGNPDMAYVSYSADACAVLRPWPDHWQRDFAPPMHMPKEFSRITLVVTEVRVQRLEEISDDDAIAEGIDQNGAVAGRDVDIDGAWWPGGPRNQYRRLWDSLNVKRAPWASNPWVVVYSFQTFKTNIDRLDIQEALQP